LPVTDIIYVLITFIEPLIRGKSIARVAVGVVAGIAAVAAVPAILGAVGFTSAGVAAGSIAARIQVWLLRSVLKL